METWKAVLDGIISAFLFIVIAALLIWAGVKGESIGWFIGFLAFFALGASSVLKKKKKIKY